jgi:hypothetical protein
MFAWNPSNFWFYHQRNQRKLFFILNLSKYFVEIEILWN